MESSLPPQSTDSNSRLSLKAKGAVIAILISVGIAITVPFCDFSPKKAKKVNLRGFANYAEFFRYEEKQVAEMEAVLKDQFLMECSPDRFLIKKWLDQEKTKFNVLEIKVKKTSSSEKGGLLLAILDPSWFPSEADQLNGIEEKTAYAHIEISAYRLYSFKDKKWQEWEDASLYKSLSLNFRKVKGKWEITPDSSDKLAPIQCDFLQKENGLQTS